MNATKIGNNVDRLIIDYMMRYSPPCRAVLMTARHLGLHLNIKAINRAEGEHLRPEYLKINPCHTIPTLVDGDLVLWESRPIMQYLCDRYASDTTLYPKDPKLRATVDRWLYTDMPLFTLARSVHILKLYFGTEPTQELVADYKNTLKLIDTLIGDYHYLAGDHLTIADLSLVANTTILALNGYKDLEECPNYKKWFQRLQKELVYYEEINGHVFEDFEQVANTMATNSGSALNGQD